MAAVCCSGQVWWAEGGARHVRHVQYGTALLKARCRYGMEKVRAWREMVGKACGQPVGRRLPLVWHLQILPNAQGYRHHFKWYKTWREVPHPPSHMLREWLSYSLLEYIYELRQIVIVVIDTYHSRYRGRMLEDSTQSLGFLPQYIMFSHIYIN